MSIGRRRFRIIKEIAEGGFGKVYLAEQISSDGFSRIVAIKLLHSKWSSHDEVVKRTRDEARVLGRIRHQHIVKVEDLTSIEGKCAIVMEYLEGVDLKWMSSFLKEKNLEFARAALFEIILAVASALDAAYSAIPLQGTQPLKAIHRDIKPSNIFVTVAGGVKVLDFGTARANFAEREAKTQALAFGSQGYMAPERMLGEEDTPAADIFSLGITLYELLTHESFGRIPPRPNKFAKKVEERVASISLNGDPDWCNQVRDTLRLMLSYTPAERPSAAQLVEIMELLAQDANDTGLRRYCRTLVSEAKEALPALDTGDPLNGTIVDEDDSGPPVTTSGPGEVVASSHNATTSTPAQTTMPPVGPGGVPQPGVVGSSVQPGRREPGISTSGQITVVAPPPAPDNVKTVNPVIAPTEVLVEGSVKPPPVRTGVPDPTPMPIEVRPTSGRGRTLGVLLVGGLLVALGVGVVFAVVTLAAMLAMSNDGSPTSTDTEPTEGLEPVPPTGREGGEAGGRIVSPDVRTDRVNVPTVLTYTDPAGASFDIRGPSGSGFLAVWDGRAPFDLGPAGEGNYQATVARPGLPKLRLKTFVVEPGTTRCAYAFDATAGDWTGGCE